MNQKTIAVIPGSFKPPHFGHYEMIKYYSQKVDEVIVLISNPSEGSKAARKVNDKVIDPLEAQKLLNLYTDDLKNVNVAISSHPSPVRAAYDLIEEMKDSHIILGSSKKDGDDVRWANIETYMKEKNPSITVEVDPVAPQGGKQTILSASGMRCFLECNDIDAALQYIPEHVNKEMAIKILKGL